MTKQEKIEKLIQMEWEDFQKVNNEGGRASCQDDPETFFIMRRSHFAPWTEELIDCVQADMDRAHEQGRNLVMEKYAWMMASTAPEQFKKLHHFLIDPTLAGEQWSDAIVKQQLAWMEEYQAKYHEYMLECFERHPFLWSTYVWNMFDFAADARDQGGEPGMNHKGLVTFDRKIKKDSFYIYKAWWSKEPFVHLCGKRYEYRAEKTTEVTVYSNQKEVTLYQNGKRISTKQGRHVFRFQVELEEENHLEAIAGEWKDSAVIYRTSNPRPEYKVKKGKSQNWV